jgi:8-oxo-dGTP pyrophosphatase MutT (NUDIX family)
LAAVLILLYPDGEEGEPHIPLILRPEDETPHAGQIALPGGRREGDEAYPLATALRESREELGIPGELIRPIGTLSPLYVGVSHVTVTPVVGCAKERPPFEPDRREVDVCFSIPVSSFFQRPLWGEFDARGISIPAPYYPTEAGKVWGATAMMLSELISIWEEIVYK